MGPYSYTYQSCVGVCYDFLDETPPPSEEVESPGGGGGITDEEVVTNPNPVTPCESAGDSNEEILQPDGTGECVTVNDDIEDELDEEELKITKFVNSLTDTERDFLLDMDLEDRSEIFTFLKKEDHSIEAKNFAQGAIRVLMDDGEVDFEDRIIKKSSFKNTKAECVYNAILNNSQEFKDRINKFDGEFPVSHLAFGANDLGTARGRTIPPNSDPSTPNSPDYVITIEINNNSSSSGMNSRPNLLLAKTIIHEVVHTEMFRKIMSVLKNSTFDGITIQQVETAMSNGDFPGIYDYFRRIKDWQHDQMANFYTNTIAAMLQEYDTGISVTSNSGIQTFYKDLSWEGLRYPSINAWQVNPNQNRINSTIANYIKNHQNETCP